MPGFNPDNINIHDLTTEEPKNEGGQPFDSEKDIIKEDWTVMKKFLEDIKDLPESNHGKWLLFLTHAEAMKILDPDINLALGEHEWNNIAGELDSVRKLTPVAAVRRMAKIKTIDPGQEFSIREDEWQKLKPLVRDLRSASEVGIEAIAAIKTIDPTRVETNIKEENINSRLVHFLTDARENGTWFRFAKYAANVRIINPDTDLSITSDDWQAMKGGLEKIRAFPSFSEFAKYLKILAAERVNITDKGIETTMLQSKLAESEVSQMPQQRKF